MRAKYLLIASGVLVLAIVAGLLISAALKQGNGAADTASSKTPLSAIEQVYVDDAQSRIRVILDDSTALANVIKRTVVANGDGGDVIVDLDGVDETVRVGLSANKRLASWRANVAPTSRTEAIGAGVSDCYTSLRKAALSVMEASTKNDSLRLDAATEYLGQVATSADATVAAIGELPPR